MTMATQLYRVKYVLPDGNGVVLEPTCATCDAQLGHYAVTGYAALGRCACGLFYCPSCRAQCRAQHPVGQSTEPLTDDWCRKVFPLKRRCARHPECGYVMSLMDH